MLIETLRKSSFIGEFGHGLAIQKKVKKYVTLSKQNEAILNCMETRKLHQVGNMAGMQKKWLYSKHTY